MNADLVVICLDCEIPKAMDPMTAQFHQRMFGHHMGVCPQQEFKAEGMEAILQRLRHRRKQEAADG